MNTIEVVALVEREYFASLRHCTDRRSWEQLEATSRQLPVTDDGRVEVRFPAETAEVAFHQLLRFGEHLEVLEPLELRARLAATARALVERYAGSR